MSRNDNLENLEISTKALLVQLESSGRRKDSKIKVHGEELILLAHPSEDYQKNSCHYMTGILGFIGFKCSSSSGFELE